MNYLQWVVLLACVAAPATVSAIDVEKDFWTRVNLDSAMTGSDAGRIREAGRLVLNTEIGRERMERFIRAGGEVFLTTTDTLGPCGHDAATASLACADTKQEPVRISILTGKNLDDPRKLAVTLAHEIFGHALLAREARTAGVFDAWEYAADDEMIALLVGMLVSLQTGTGLDEDDREFVAGVASSTRAFAAIEWGGGAGYPHMLFPEEFEAPETALRRHLDHISEEHARWSKNRAAAKTWEREIVHFQTMHEMPAARFHSIWERTQEAILDRNAYYIRLRDLVESRMGYFILPEGVRARKRLLDPDVRSFVQSRRAELLALRAGMVAAMGRQPPGVPAANATAAPGDAIGWEELKDLVRRDESDHPEHWR